MRDEGSSLNFSESQSTTKKTIQLYNWWGNYNEMMMKPKTKLLWKCLACTKGCWDPEFQPSVEEIVDYRWWWWWFSQFTFFGELALGGISPFSLAYGKWRSRPGQPAQAVCTNIRAYGACSVCQCVLVQIMGTVAWRNTFHEGQGMYM